MKSIKKTLLCWLAGSLAAGIAATATLTYRQTRQEANEIFDYQMKQIADSLPSRAFLPLEPGRQQGKDSHIVIQIWDSRGLRIYGSHLQPGVPQWAEIGFSTIKTPEGDWRVYGAQLGETVVQISQPLAVRRNLAAGIAVRTVAPLLLMLRRTFTICVSAAFLYHSCVSGVRWLEISTGMRFFISDSAFCASSTCCSRLKLLVW